MAPLWFTRPLMEGDEGRDVLIVQRLLGLLPTGRFDAATVLTVRGFQRGAGLHPTGAVDDRTAFELGEQDGFGQLPPWWREPATRPGDPEYAHALELLGADDMDGVKRFQGNHHLPPTGVVDETTARLLAGMEVESWGITLPEHHGGGTRSNGSVGPPPRRGSPQPS